MSQLNKKCNLVRHRKESNHVVNFALFKCSSNHAPVLLRTTHSVSYLLSAVKWKKGKMVVYYFWHLNAKFFSVHSKFLGSRVSIKNYVPLYDYLSVLNVSAKKCFPFCYNIFIFVCILFLYVVKIRINCPNIMAKKYL